VRVFDAFVIVVALLQTLSGRVEARYQFHLLTPSVTRRLSPAARANVRTVVRFGVSRASGFLVAGVPGRDRTGLVLTNQHVAAGTWPGEGIMFHDGTTSQVRRVLVSSAALDYALIEIPLPRLLNARPAQLSYLPIRRGERVYAISGAANPWALSAPVSLTTAPSVRPLPTSNGLRAAFTIQEGVENGRGTASPIRVEATGTMVPSLSFHLPNAPGASGSPVFSSTRNRVVALHWGGNAKLSWNAWGTPIRTILADLRRRVGTGELPLSVYSSLSPLPVP
jgi:hypothetical protein